MPIYFFDIYENGTFIPDTRGMEFARLDAAEREAAEAAIAIARERLPGSASQTIRVKVRDEGDHHLLTATATLTVEHVTRHQPR